MTATHTTQQDATMSGMSADVLAFTVPTFDPDIPTRRYPSVNGMWAQGTRYGKKTLEYHYLFEAVREAARAEMERTGWVTATSRVEMHIRRYVPNLIPSDAGNIGKCESDAMQPSRAGEKPFPGVYVNDNLVRPFPDVVPDLTPGAIDRIAIAVFRIPAPVSASARKPRAKAPVAQQSAAAGPVAPAARTAPKTTGWRAGDPIPPGYALLGNELVPIADALALIAGDRKDAAPRARRGAR